MIEDIVTQNAALARSRHRIEPLLSVSYTADFALQIGVLRIKILPDCACYAGVFKLLAWSDPIHTGSFIVRLPVFFADLEKILL